MGGKIDFFAPSIKVATPTDFGAVAATHRYMQPPIHTAQLQHTGDANRFDLDVDRAKHSPIAPEPTWKKRVRVAPSQPSFSDRLNNERFHLDPHRYEYKPAHTIPEPTRARLNHALEQLSQYTAPKTVLESIGHLTSAPDLLITVGSVYDEAQSAGMVLNSAHSDPLSTRMLVLDHSIVNGNDANLLATLGALLIGAERTLNPTINPIIFDTGRSEINLSDELISRLYMDDFLTELGFDINMTDDLLIQVVHEMRLSNRWPAHRAQLLASLPAPLHERLDRVQYDGKLLTAEAAMRHLERQLPFYEWTAQSGPLIHALYTAVLEGSVPTADVLEAVGKRAWANNRHWLQLALELSFLDAANKNKAVTKTDTQKPVIVPPMTN